MTHAKTSAGTGGASQAAIEHHYDVGRDFYRLWLGPSMVYSCALWDGSLDQDLDQAQLRKLAWHANAARAEGKAKVLDIGCGWGAMLGHLLAHCNVGQVTGLTLSPDQRQAIGAAPGCEVRLQDWRDHRPDHPYDAIVSIGAFEHFARHDLPQAERQAIYRSFFQKCAQWLPSGARLSLQSIALDDPAPTGTPTAMFFAEEVFPESGLPTLTNIITAAEPDFRLVDFRNDGHQYEHTLHLWQQKLESHKDEALDMVGKDVFRHYVRYLRVSRAMFDRRVCTLYRLAFERRPVSAP